VTDHAVGRRWPSTHALPGHPKNPPCGAAAIGQHGTATFERASLASLVQICRVVFGERGVSGLFHCGAIGDTSGRDGGFTVRVEGKRDGDILQELESDVVGDGTELLAVIWRSVGGGPARVQRWSSEHRQERLCHRRKLRRDCGTFNSAEELGEVDRSRAE
jgi:hypothetical protein